jgi:hypothetical protein
MRRFVLSSPRHRGRRRSRRVASSAKSAVNTTPSHLLGHLFPPSRRASFPSRPFAFHTASHAVPSSSFPLSLLRTPTSSSTHPSEPSDVAFPPFLPLPLPLPSSISTLHLPTIQQTLPCLSLSVSLPFLFSSLTFPPSSFLLFLVFSSRSSLLFSGSLFVFSSLCTDFVLRSVLSTERFCRVAERIEESKSIPRLRSRLRPDLTARLAPGPADARTASSTRTCHPS